MARNAMSIWNEMQKQGRHVCMGIDPWSIESLPEDALVRDARGNTNIEESLIEFTSALVDAVSYVVGAVKPNLAFWEKFEEDGTRALRRLVRYVHSTYPWLLVIADAKRNDIGRTAEDYADAIFKGYDFDACTVNPMLGTDGIKPFTDYADKMTILLVRTSNPSAAAQQDIQVVTPDGRSMLQHEWTAHQVAGWNGSGNCAVVVGATVPAQMERIRRILGDSVPILSPGFGKQGADPKVIIPAALGEDGLNIIANSSSGLMYAYREGRFAGLSYAEATLKATLEFHNEISKWRRFGMARQIMEKVGALKTGHFVLKAGDHAALYVDKDTVTMRPADTRVLAKLIAEMLDDLDLDSVIGPAYGGISLASYVAEELNIRSGLTGNNQIKALYVTKMDDGTFVFKGNHAEQAKGRRSVIAEDVVTTGMSARGVVDATEAVGGKVIAVSAVWNRGGVKSIGETELRALVEEAIPKYPADECPLCADGVPVNTDVGHGKQYLAERGS